MKKYLILMLSLLINDISCMEKEIGSSYNNSISVLPDELIIKIIKMGIDCIQLIQNIIQLLKQLVL